ncbi:[protein-PII] uridylyltransferase family protein [Anianabacter salinae]|uniref:[protein-PII] uridylyltransferase family protein n=1 Tax=Anianabacter salinae TaxID=2851023 RepID=UPI00225E199B|nr:glutamine-synthetase adenylyltransferase [Anianabacter salinae]MBV0911585.1 glutamine-synthetase adenylyltransferase [Anianabacter salinae]
MSFADRLTRCPDPYDRDRAQEARDRMAGLAQPMLDLIGGAAGCSPYLKSLIDKEAGWLGPALDGAPEDAAQAVLDEAAAAARGEVPSALRRAKRRIALLTALADLGGVWPLETVTGTLTRLADLATDVAIKAALGPDLARGKVPGMTEADLPQAAGMVALAMGKGGAFELNYSSDIDLIVLFDTDRFDDPADAMEARQVFVRATRRMAQTLGEQTAEGYVFRVDLRLRPDAAVTPVCLSMDAAEGYYESVGRTWERAAYIKARASAGDLDAGARFLDRLRPFVWRKHLDFAAIQDAHDMRLRIREHKGLGGPIRLDDGHDMKLGRGGIREIEFFTQTRQLIAGGRDADLRVRGTVDGLARLADKGWVPRDVADTLTDDYRAHREVEHRLQMINDAQTHDLPTTPEGFDRLAAFMGQSADALRADLTERLTRVHEMTEGFFAPGAPGTSAPAPPLAEAARDTVEKWQSYPALRSTRAREIFERLKPEILSRLTKAAEPDEALAQFDAFLSGLPAGVQLFSLFEANPQLIDLIVDIAATSPRLSVYLGRNAQVLDAVIGGAFFDAWPGQAALTADLAGHLGAAADYEAQLDTARRWAREWHFRVGVHLLRGLITPRDAGRQYTDLAEAVLGALYPAVVADFARKHGAPPGQGACVLGMGSLGAGRLNAASDLDIIVIYDAGGVEASDGRRPLDARAYYARLTQALVTALTAPMAEGRLYEIDMRLRPSGRQGPVATSLAAFESYQRGEAWTWEHLALTRARPVAGEAALGARVEAFRQDLLAALSNPATILADVAEMRARLADAKSAPGPYEAKTGPGRLQDIELLGQAAARLAGDPARTVSEQIAAGAATGWLTGDERDALCAAHDLLWRVQVSTRLLTDGALDPDAIGEGGRGFLLAQTEASSLDALADRILDETERASAIVTRCLDRAPGSG